MSISTANRDSMYRVSTPFTAEDGKKKPVNVGNGDVLTCVGGNEIRYIFELEGVTIYVPKRTAHQCLDPY